MKQAAATIIGVLGMLGTLYMAVRDSHWGLLLQGIFVAAECGTSPYLFCPPCLASKDMGFLLAAAAEG